jgi:hypothetical protein
VITASPDSCITGDVRLEKLGEELAPDSSVWSTYMAAAGADDKGMVDDWNKSLDVLLIFVRSSFMMQLQLADGYCVGKSVLCRRNGICASSFELATTRL